MEFVGGILIGFFVSFFVLKSQINKTGAGELKVCKTCPYYKPVVITDSESEDND